MKFLTKLSQMMLVVFAVAALSACGDDSAEDAGEKVDEMVTDAGNAVEDACEEVKEGVDAEDKDC